MGKKINKILLSWLLIVCAVCFVGCEEKSVKIPYNARIIRAKIIQERYLIPQDDDYLSDICWLENTIEGLYVNEEYTTENSGDKYYYDSKSPQSRVIVVSNQEEYQHNCIVHRQKIEFGKEMLIIYIYRAYWQRMHYISWVTFEDGILSITYDAGIKKR